MASDGKNLRLYQAVVDARKLLDELSDPETSVSGNTHTSLQRKQNIIQANVRFLNLVVHMKSLLALQWGCVSLAGLWMPQTVLSVGNIL